MLFRPFTRFLIKTFVPAEDKSVPDKLSERSLGLRPKKRKCGANPDEEWGVQLNFAQALINTNSIWTFSQMTAYVLDHAWFG